MGLGINKPAASISAMIRNMSHRHNTWQVFADFVESSAIAISNSVDLRKREEREKRYMELIERYTPEEIAIFPQMLGQLVNQLDEETTDVLGRVFHDLELHNKYNGQFFTPFELCRMMAKMTIDTEHLGAVIKKEGHVRVQEPCVGSGAMIIAFSKEMRAAGFDPQSHLHVTAVDVDLKCVHMAYLQLSLLHIPAVIVHGNTLSLEEWSHWYTPAHILNGWGYRLRRQSATEETESVPVPLLAMTATASNGQSQLSLF